MYPSNYLNASLTSSHNTLTASTPASTSPQRATQIPDPDPYADWKQQMRNKHEARILSTSAMMEANFGRPTALAWELGQGYYRLLPQ